MSAALLSSRHTLDISPVWVGASATIGAIIGDTIGYSIGHRFGMSLFERLGNRFPKHFGPGHVALAKQLFARWGVWAVFFGRFIALLRIFAGPLAGALKMRYPYFLAANASGAVCGPVAPRPSSTTPACRGAVAVEVLLDRARRAIVIGIGMTLLLRERTARAIAHLEDKHDWESLRRH